MEAEENESIAFINLLVNKRDDGTLGHQVFIKKTHTNNYLHANFDHHPAQKIVAINTLVMMVVRIFYTGHLKQEQNHLTKAFKSMGYRDAKVRRVIKRDKRSSRSSQPRNNLLVRKCTSLHPRCHG
jgi:hypothetical protein